MRSLAVLVVLLGLSACASGSSWAGEARVNHWNGDTSDQQNCIKMDHTGHPWAVWTRGPVGLGETTLMFSRWQGSEWEPECGVGINAPNALVRLRASLAFDRDGRAWLAWTNDYGTSTYDIGASCWEDSVWSPEVRVNAPDSAGRDMVPKVACGGGRVWCVWYDGPMPPCAVYASYTTGPGQAWQPEMRVSPPDTDNHWFCDVAVDSTGTPHVVWVDVNRYLIHYSYYDGTEWVGPTAVNDTSLVKAPYWADPHIVIDGTGIMHVSYTGVLNGAPARDVFYTRNDGSGWSASVRVTQDTVTNYSEWYSAIAADRPDNVWIAWDRQHEGTDQFRVYASHFDGVVWTPEQRLDGDSAYYDMFPSASLDYQGRPLVTWDGMTYSATNSDIYYNYIPGIGGTSEAPLASSLAQRAILSISSPTRGRMSLRYELDAPSRVQIEVYDGLGRLVWSEAERYQAAGQHAVAWHCRDCKGGTLTSGTYFCRVSAGDRTEVLKFVLQK
jgi:hypothetical protein